jgi:3'-phosphoadenosine 5'-phosphosulfate sulfotransferase (PAPS reductase)/FAD synthetase
LQEADRLLGCVALDTGINVPEWRPTLEKMCAKEGWPLEVFSTDESYEDLVRKYGFPGVSKHKWMVDYLKGRGVVKFRKAHPDAPLASGVRVAESSRRSLSTLPISKWEGVTIYAPILYWTTSDVWKYVKERGYERPQSYTNLGISGDCLCGSFAAEWERDAIKKHYPSIDERLKVLEADPCVQAHKRRACWGWSKKRLHQKTGVEALICVECGQGGDDRDSRVEQPAETGHAEMQ